MSDSEIVKEFLVESYENLDRLDRDLIALEKEPTNREILASVLAPFTPSREPRAFWPSTNWRP